MDEIFILDKYMTKELTGEVCHFKIRPNDPKEVCLIKIQRTGAWHFEYFTPLRFQPGDFFKEHASRLLKRQKDLLEILENGRLNNSRGGTKAQS